MNMVSTTIYINAPLSIYPSSVSKTEFLAAVLNIYAVKAEDLFCWKKGTGAAETMLYQSRIGRARMETRSSKEHMRCTCVWSPNPEELQGKRRYSPKRYVTAL